MRRTKVVWSILILVGCQSKPQEPVPSDAPQEPGTVQALEASPLQNAFRVSDRLYSGGSPEGDVGFRELKRLGIQTIISVDGAKPDAESARRYGMTYVHLPFGYDGIPRERLIALLKATRELPAPIYVHCHHGKHRGPAAVAVIQLCNDPRWDIGAAEAWLKTAGTDPRYTGLTNLPRTLTRPSQEELDQSASSFPDHVEITDIARIMVELDAQWDHLNLVKEAGWKVPKSHPDLVPSHEAIQLAEHYREAARLDDAKRRGSGFIKVLAEAEAAAMDLEKALRAKSVDGDSADKAFARSAAACTSCHTQFRDRPGKP